MKNTTKVVDTTEKINGKRRTVICGTVGLGVTGIVIPGKWSKPIIESVLLPAHAQTSEEPDPDPPTPEELCPMIVTGNVVFGPISGANSATSCTASFQVLSADSGVDLNIVDVTNGPLVGASTSVSFSGAGPATSLSGPSVSWTGAALAAPTCSDLNTANGQPLDDVLFTVTASCEDSAGGEFSQDFTLLDIISNGSLGNP